MSKRQSQARWDAAHPLERWAHAALRSALKKGIIQKQPCAICGSSDSEAHHPDYSRPAQVVWLCRLHHRAAHKQLRIVCAEAGAPETSL